MVYCKLYTMGKHVLFILFIGLVSSFSVNAQEPTDTTSTNTAKVIVTTNDGKERVGVILSDDGREILLLSESIGKVYIAKIDIESIKPIEREDVQEYDGDYRTSGPFTTRYYFTTNALPIKKTEDYAMIHLYGPEVHFSVNDRLSLGIMSSWIASPFVLAAKFTIPTKNEKINFGIGTLMGSSGYLNTFRGYGGLHWGMITIGVRMSNLTISAGYSYVQPGFKMDEYAVGTYYPDSTQQIHSLNIPIETVTSSLIQAPVFSIAGVTKVGKRASFFFDSMLFLYSIKRGTGRNFNTIPDPNGGYY